PGMATRGALDELEAATGSEAERIYLALMIAHHEGAIATCTTLGGKGEAVRPGESGDASTPTQTKQSLQMRAMRARLRGLSSTLWLITCPDRTNLVFDSAVDKWSEGAMGKSQDQLSRAFAALADPIRRDIVARLTVGDATVSDLAAPYDVSLQAVSKHLRVLEDAG